MKTNIETTTMQKHFFSNSKKKNPINKRPHITKIVNYCFVTINEANVCDKIKNIPYYSNNFSVLEEYDFININQLNDELKFEKIHLNDEKKYLFFKYQNAKYVKFNIYLFGVINPKLLIFNVIESFSYLLNGLIKLNENNICFFNLTPENIIFNLDCGEKPFLKNFRHSLLVSKLNETYITNIINSVDDYTHKPLEIHILFYIIKNDIPTISQLFIEEICDVFVKNISVLNFFSNAQKETYKLSCVEYLKTYINKPKSYIISDILTHNNTWDTYSLSVLYLHIFSNIYVSLSLKNIFLHKLIIVLFNNISPNPSKRCSLQNLLSQFNNLLNDSNDWSFVNDISFLSIHKLLDNLEK